MVSWNKGRGQLGNQNSGSLKHVCSREMKETRRDITCWESTARDRKLWRSEIHHALKRGEKRIVATVEAKRAKRKATARAPPASTDFACEHCNRICCSHVGLLNRQS